MILRFLRHYRRWRQLALSRTDSARMAWWSATYPHRDKVRVP